MEDVAEGPTLLPTMSGEFVTITKKTTVSGEENEEQRTKTKWKKPPLFPTLAN